VEFGAGEDADGGRAGQAFLFYIPLLACQEGVAGSEEADDVRHLAAGDESEAGGRGEVEQVFEPCAGNFFDDGGGRGGGVHRGVLIPGGGKPVGRESGGE